MENGSDGFESKVLLDEGIGGEKVEVVGEGLADKQAVEGIAVNERKGGEEEGRGFGEGKFGEGMGSPDFIPAMRRGSGLCESRGRESLPEVPIRRKNRLRLREADR